MKQITSLLVLLGITLLIYGLYNCNCKKISIEKFDITPTPTITSTATPNINNKTEKIKLNINEISSIIENNKYLIDKTNQIRQNMQKFIKSKH